MVRVTNDLLCAVDKKQAVILVLLDLSAAFDTVDHSILLQRLRQEMGVCDMPLQWFESYLTGRKQTITINRTSSSQANLLYGVPQGSVLGPVVFTCYIKPLGDIARKYGLELHIYADDTQLYLAFKPMEGEEQAIERVQACIAEMREWMKQNKLQCNDGKTEVMIVCSPHHRAKVNIPHLQIGSSKIQPVSSVRDIGAQLDNTLNMRSHVNSLCSRAHFALRNISKIRHLLDRKTTTILVHAYVTSRLDNGNALLCGLPQVLLSKLQRVQNSAARLVCRTNWRDHITPVLQELHWLPVQQRICFKVLTLAYQAIHGTAPQYLVDLVSWYRPQRTLRSSDSLLLVEPQSRLRTYGDRAFKHAAPRLWNKLPVQLRSATTLSAFKRSLKTFLFREAYDIHK